MLIHIVSENQESDQPQFQYLVILLIISLIFTYLTPAIKSIKIWLCALMPLVEHQLAEERAGIDIRLTNE